MDEILYSFPRSSTT